jgi:hypothetical protein
MDAQLFELASLLHKLTMAGTLQWKHSADDNALVSTFQRQSIVFARTYSDVNHPGEEASPIYIISVIDQKGKVVETFTDEDLDNASRSGENVFFRKLDEAFERAVRIATGTEKVVSDLLKQMSRLDPDDIPF